VRARATRSPRVVIEGPPSWLLLHSLVVLRKRPVPHRHTHAVTKRMSEKPVRRIDDGNEAMPPRLILTHRYGYQILVGSVQTVM
jgi:hypothetical protein